MNIQDVQQASKSRADRWHDTPESKWSLLEWAGSMCGESGEAANLAKKIKRLDSKMRNLDKRGLRSPALEDVRADYVKKLAKETADSILYGICIFNELGVDAAAVLRAVFNEKSEEYDFPERI